MSGVIQLTAQSTTDTIVDIMRRVSKARLTLIVPAEMPSEQLDLAQLQRLYEQCAIMAKEIVFVGGNDLFRATAVAAGFVVATSLADSAGDEGAHPADVPSFYVTQDPLPPLTIVDDADAAHADDTGDLYEALNDEPPSYVLDLLAYDGLYPGPHDSHPSANESDEDDAFDTTEHLRITQERYEEDITSTIRSTGGISPA